MTVVTAESRDSVSGTPSGESQTPPGSPSETDADWGTRIASAAVGGTLVALGLRRRSLGGAAMATVGGWLFYRGATGRGRPSRTFGGSTAADSERREAGAPATATEVAHSTTVRRPADELSEFWRDPDHLTRIFGEFADVVSTGENRQRWAVHAPLGRTMAWNAHVAEDRPGEVLRWESEPGATVPNEGTVRFRPAPGDRGTEVTLRLRFDLPGGALGDAAMRLLGVVPDTIAESALRRFKSLAETGEIPTLERNPSGRGSGDRI